MTAYHVSVHVESVLHIPGRICRYFASHPMDWPEVFERDWNSTICSECRMRRQSMSHHNEEHFYPYDAETSSQTTGSCPQQDLHHRAELQIVVATTLHNRRITHFHIISICFRNEFLFIQGGLESFGEFRMFDFLWKSRREMRSEENLSVDHLLVPNRRCWWFDLWDVYCRVYRWFHKLCVSARVLHRLSQREDIQWKHWYPPRENSRNVFCYCTERSVRHWQWWMGVDSSSFPIVRRKVLPSYLWKTPLRFFLRDCFWSAQWSRQSSSHRCLCE